MIVDNHIYDNDSDDKNFWNHNWSYMIFLKIIIHRLSSMIKRIDHMWPMIISLKVISSMIFFVPQKTARLNRNSVTPKNNYVIIDKLCHHGYTWHVWYIWSYRLRPQHRSEIMIMSKSIININRRISRGDSRPNYLPGLTGRLRPPCG